jgi:hypothetical protein
VARPRRLTNSRFAIFWWRVARSGDDASVNQAELVGSKIGRHGPRLAASLTNVDTSCPKGNDPLELRLTFAPAGICGPVDIRMHASSTAGSVPLVRRPVILVLAGAKHQNRGIETVFFTVAAVEVMACCGSLDADDAIESSRRRL